VLQCICKQEIKTKTKEVIKIESCKFCNRTGTESHHIVYRSQVKGLINCKLNQVRLCNSCHNYLHKGKKGYELDYALKKEFQANIEMLFLGQAFTLEEIKGNLEISDKASYGLSKLMKLEKGKYTRESIILALLGGEYPLERYKKARSRNGT